MHRRRRRTKKQTADASKTTTEEAVVGRYDAATEGRLLSWMPNTPAPSMIHRLFRKRPASPHREARYGEGEDHELGPPF